MKVYKCKICRKIFTLISLKTHLREKHGKFSYQWKIYSTMKVIHSTEVIY